MSKITYANKVALNVNPDVPDINKCTADNMNEIKEAVNDIEDNKVSFNDYAVTNGKGGIIKVGTYGTRISPTNNQLYAVNISNMTDYENASNNLMVGKGTLETRLNTFLTYSTKEQLIGKWKDNKPMYRKIIEVTGLTVANNVEYAHGIENIETICKYEAYFIQNNFSSYMTYPLVSNNGLVLTALLFPTKIQWVGNDSWGPANRKHIFIIYYTKTTD